MSAANQFSSTTSEAEHFDVLIVGAGISGVGGAVHLQQQCPDKRFVILETQGSFGGTWLTHKYPGIRSDSDLYTFGYRFKPWSGKPIATAEAIREYMEEVIEENHLAGHIRYHHRVERASWDSDSALWTLEVRNSVDGSLRTFTGRFLWMCQGYYRHEKGYTPEWPGMENFKGDIVHPQEWKEDYDYTGKRVVVIGSGATAATVVPAMADKAAHVTMLQRSPTYFAPGENRNELADSLRELEIPEEWVHEIVRRRILKDGQEITRRSFEEPEALRDELIGAAKAYLGPDYEVDKHFNPSYRPWRQRLAFIPDGDLFKGIAEGKASVVTDEIDCFTENGIKTRSGEVLEADLILTATGFNLCILGDIDFTIDGEPLRFEDSYTWLGMLYSNVPNMCWVFGYLRTSWTMRSDLIGDFVCRLLKHMDETGVQIVTPTLRSEDKAEPPAPFVDPENFNAGYLLRSMDQLPKQGPSLPWQFPQDYYRERELIPAAKLDDETLVYRHATATVKTAAG